MKRVKRHKIKQELPETSTARFRDQEEHDLAYYIHDRVELMHQVFSVIKPKELKAMAPECVYDISVADLQELCTEELLGISSKRLCAVLDGADPPTDTESSSSEHLETISLDSISSDDEVLSQHSSKKKHKHRKHKSKNKHKRKNSKASDNGDQEAGEEEDRSKASRAGLTVLELLELQARARAIRAQLQQDNAHAVTAKPQQNETKVKDSSDEDEVEIKEEPAEVVEISSEDEKPKIEDLPVKPPSSNKGDQASGPSKTVTKRINDLIVTVPQAKQNKKIVLNRNKSITTTAGTSSSEASKTKDSSNNEATNSKVASSTETDPKVIASTSKESNAKTIAQQKSKLCEVNNKLQSKLVNTKPKQKKKQKKKDKKSDKEEDHDEITLQLSDSEKMDLLEDFDRKNYENFTSSSEDSESSSESESEIETSQNSTINSQENKANATNIQENNSRTNDKMDIHSQENNTFVALDKEITQPEIAITSDKETLESDSNKQEKINDSIENNEESIKAHETEPINTGDSDKNEKESSPNISSSRPLQNDPAETSENDSIGKGLNMEIGTNKSTNTEIETTKEDNRVVTQNQEHQVIESIIIQVKNDSFTESQYNETQTMRSVIVKVGNNYSENVEASSDNGDEGAINTKAIKNTLARENEVVLRVTDKNESIEEGEITNTNKELSEGEITDNEEQQETQINITVSPNKSEVVCISDEEGGKRKKKKKKEKKSKKEKRSKKTKSDFREGADQNFFRKAENKVLILEKHDEHVNENSTVFFDIHVENKEQDDIVVIPEDAKLDQIEKESKTIAVDIQERNNQIDDDIVSLDDDDDIYEILEISDDSSCYEVEGISVSKEPTAAEIAALSAKIDEINTDDVIVINEEEGEDENGENESNMEENNVINEEIEKISWRDRYLGSKKVKRVLTTSNILNALRKKNKELKRKLEESKKEIENVTEGDKVVLAEISEFVEGSIEHFNTLQGSTKYVDPIVPEVPKNQEDQNKDGKDAEVGIKQVTKEMEKDAKQLLKMYKRLLKYNDMNKKKDPTKKKKKKHKKSKEKNTVANEK